MIPCNHKSCGHQSTDKGNHFLHDAMHFTASVMGNPDYLDAVKDIKQAPDQRMEGLDQVNAYHASHMRKKES